MRPRWRVHPRRFNGGEADIGGLAKSRAMAEAAVAEEERRMVQVREQRARRADEQQLENAMKF